VNLHGKIDPSPVDRYPSQETCYITVILPSAAGCRAAGGSGDPILRLAGERLNLSPNGQLKSASAVAGVDRRPQPLTHGHRLWLCGSDQRSCRRDYTCPLACPGGQAPGCILCHEYMRPRLDCGTLQIAQSRTSAALARAIAFPHRPARVAAVAKAMKRLPAMQRGAREGARSDSPNSTVRLVRSGSLIGHPVVASSATGRGPRYHCRVGLDVHTELEALVRGPLSSAVGERPRVGRRALLAPRRDRTVCGP
jgi:hypothetical protein